jgi:predicted HAD superfamily hydrolase
MQSHRSRTFRHFDNLIDSLRGEVPGDPFTTLSFDVFDTLIHRRCHPQVVVDAVGSWLTRECAQAGIDMHCDALIGRQRAYEHMTSLKEAQGLDPDCNLTELSRTWIAEITKGQNVCGCELANRLEAYEVELEKAVCFANAPFIDLIDHLKQKGFRLLYISDMYLGRHVDDILDACGFAGLFDQGYVSGEVAQLKRTGALFRYVLSSEVIAASELLHIGDNPINDGVRAVGQGISSYVIRDGQELRRYHALEFDWRYVKRNREYAGFAAAAFATSAIGENGSFAESVGVRLLGPIYASFLHGVAGHCADENIRNVFFVAREGSVLKDMFLELVPLVSRSCSIPNATYIGFSRQTALLYAMNDLGIRELAKIGLNTSHHSLRNILAPLGLPMELLSEVASTCGIHDINAALPSHYLQWGAFHQVLRHTAIRSYIDELVGRSHRLIGTYLEQRGLFRQHRAALIDVGWNAQIQENLYFGMLDRVDRPQLFGFYLGTMLRADWTRNAHNCVTGILASEERVNWHSHAAFEFVSVLEACVRAPHGTVIGHTESLDGEVTPSFRPDTEKSRQVELENELMIAQLQTGMRAFTSRYRQAADLFGFEPTQTVPYARLVLDRLVRFPTKEEASVFLPINNVSDLGSSDVWSLSPGLIGMPLWKAWFELFSIVKKSKWRYGSFAVLKLRFLQPLYAISVRFHTAKQGQSLSQVGLVAPEPTPSDYYREQVWHGIESDSPPPPQAYELELKEHERALADLGRKAAEPIPLRELTLPLSFREALLPWVTSQIAQLAWRVMKRDRLEKDAMKIRPILFREIYSRYPRLVRGAARTFGVAP